MNAPVISELTPREAHLVVPLLDYVQSLHVEAHPNTFRDDASPAERAEFVATWMAQGQHDSARCQNR